VRSLKHLIILLTFANILLGASWFSKDSVQTFEEEVYLSFRYQGVIDEILIAYYGDDKFYLPLTELFDLFAINYDLSPATLSVSGFFLQENQHYLLDFSRRFGMLEDEVWSISANDFLVKEVDFFVTPKVLNEIFGLDLIIDLSRLTLRLETKHELPIVTRHTRRYKEELRSKYGGDGDQENYELLVGRDARTLDGALMDYSIYSSIGQDNRNINLNMSVGGEVLYGDVQGALQTALNQDVGSLRSTDLRWRYANDSPDWYSTVTLGQQSSSGLTTQTFQGLAITNQPLVPQRSYDTYLIDGTTDPEAEVELYQNNHLVDVIKSDDVGYYRFMVPLNYGVSDFTIRIYAKQGRVIELDRRVQIPFNFLPVSEVRYNVSTGRVASETLSWEKQRNTTSANVAMGLRNWLTGGVGLEYVEDNNQDRPVFYGQMSSRVAGDILLGLDIALKNYYRLSMRGVGPNTSSMSMDYVYYDQKSSYNTLGINHNLNTSLFYPFQIAKRRFTGRSTLAWQNLPGENRFNLNLDVNQYLRSLRLRYGLREQHTYSSSGHVNSSQAQFGAVYTIPRIPSMHILLRGSYFRTDLSFNTSIGEMEDIKFQFIKQFSSHLKGQLLSSYNLIQSNPYIEVGVTWDMDALRSTTTVRTIKSTPSITQTVRGSMGLDRHNNEFLFDNRQQVGRSGVSIRMFIDDDNSGTYDEGEEVLPGNAVSIERSSSRQITQSGISRLTQLQPYRRYNFRVNEARVNNPMLVASKRKFSVVTDPNRYKQVDVPFYTTGVIDGRVDRIKEGEFLPISGLRIHIKRDIGEFETTLRTFGDGSFYSMEIPPGSYEMWIDDSQLEFLQMNSVPEKQYFTIKASAEGDFVEELNFLLE